ncbi:MAG: SDR family oxidoreductase [Actinobacteria bacterium]|nr:SDR family oxidoreductase [Actinomycetota bacterium]
MPDATDYQVPDQSGRTALITGANSGIGFEASKRLAQAGAQVLLACRNPDKAADALSAVRAAAPGASVDVLALDLSSLESVREAAEKVHADHERLDLLVNNAGVMAIPREETVDGFERQFGTNHLGHFALTGQLIDLVLAAPESRVVTISSGAHKAGRIDFDDLQGEKRYRKWGAYGQSKLANLLFAYELQRRLTEAGSSTLSVAAHPGWSATNLQTSGRGVTGGPMLFFTNLANRIMGQPASMGALPTLHAATSPDAEPGGYYGPDGFQEGRGFPTKVASNDRSRSEADARRLWEESERLTGVTYDLNGPHRPSG